MPVLLEPGMSTTTAERWPAARAYALERARAVRVAETLTRDPLAMWHPAPYAGAKSGRGVAQRCEVDAPTFDDDAALARALRAARTPLHLAAVLRANRQAIDGDPALTARYQSRMDHLLGVQLGYPDNDTERI